MKIANKMHRKCQKFPELVKISFVMAHYFNRILTSTERTQVKELIFETEEELEVLFAVADFLDNP